MMLSTPRHQNCCLTEVVTKTERHHYKGDALRQSNRYSKLKQLSLKGTLLLPSEDDTITFNVD